MTDATRASRASVFDAGWQLGMWRTASGSDAVAHGERLEIENAVEAIAMGDAVALEALLQEISPAAVTRVLRSDVAMRYVYSSDLNFTTGVTLLGLAGLHGDLAASKCFKLLFEHAGFGGPFAQRAILFECDGGLLTDVDAALEFGDDAPWMLGYWDQPNTALMVWIGLTLESRRGDVPTTWEGRLRSHSPRPRQQE